MVNEHFTKAKNYSFKMVLGYDNAVVPHEFLEDAVSSHVTPK